MYRKGVVAIILNQNNEILLVNLILFEKIFFAIPGGGIDVNETKIEIIKESSFPIKFRFNINPLIRD